MSLQGKVIIVTGAARGLGREYAESFASQGAKVVAADIMDCGDTLKGIKAEGEGIAVHLDVTDMKSAAAMVSAAVEAFGHVNGLVNNAALYGGLKGGRFEKITEEEWDACMAVNVKGIWNCCKAVIPVMREQQSGSIVNIASLAATYGTPYALHYTTSKAAVIGMTRGLARELGRDGIRVNAVAPSAVITEGTNEFFGEKSEKVLDRVRSDQTIQRNLEPADLVGTVAYLLSEASAFVTGQTISVDGGTVMT